jgi:two-component system response regulator MprA
MTDQKRILIIDDDQHGRESLRLALRDYGYHVAVCEDGPEALALLAREEFAIILTDFLMPKMDGLELTKKMRERCPAAVILGMSALAVEDDFLRAGANGFLLKPFLPSQFLSAVERLAPGG